MAKKKKSPTQKAFKPEDYIRTKARQLPIYKCYKSINPIEDREMSIFVVRKHPQGTFTIGGYMLDRWCLGVKDSFYNFSVDEDRLDDIIYHFKNSLPTFEEISYVEAHNWVYGAHDFAADAGIAPCKEFAISKYILEEDDDNVELIEYDFGKNGTGKYCLVTFDAMEASKYMPILDKTLGKGNYGIEIGPLGDEDIDDEYDDEDDEYYNSNLGAYSEIEYTYKGIDYPQSITLNHPEILDILVKEVSTIKKQEITNILSLPADSLRTDLHNVILWEIGRQWDQNLDDLYEKDGTHFNIITNALMVLTDICSVEDSLPIVLEVMRQGTEFYDYNFGDMSDMFLWPILCKLCKDNPRLLLPYLLEPGLSEHFKNTTLDLLDHIARNYDDIREEMTSMFIELLNAYTEDLPDSTICNGAVAGFAVCIPLSLNAKECIPAIKELYATGLVDKSICGNLDTVISDFDSPCPYKGDLPVMDTMSIWEKSSHFHD